MKNSKLKPRDLQIILIVAGIVAVFLSYKFVFASLNESTAALEKENTALEARCADLQDKKDNQLKYSAQIERDEKESKEILDKFPQNFEVETNIEYMIKLIKKADVTIQSVSYEPVGVYYNFVGEDKTSTDGQPTISATKVSCTFKTSYKGMKEMIKFINKEYNRMKIEDINCNATPENSGLAGTVVFTAYSSDSSDVGRKYTKPKFKVRTGKDGGIFSQR